MIKKYICELLEESLIPNKKGLFGLTVLYKICGAYSLRSRVTSAKVAGAAGASPPKLSVGGLLIAIVVVSFFVHLYEQLII